MGGGKGEAIGGNVNKFEAAFEWPEEWPVPTCKGCGVPQRSDDRIDSVHIGIRKVVLGERLIMQVGYCTECGIEHFRERDHSLDFVVPLPKWVIGAMEGM